MELILKEIMLHDRVNPKLIGCLQLKKINDKVVSIQGCNIDVSTVIYHDCTSDKIISSWNYVMSDGNPINNLAQLFFFNTLFKKLIIKEPGISNVDKEIQVSNKFPDTIILLSLCFWIQRCQELAIEKQYCEKFNEFKGNLKNESISNTLARISCACNILKNKTLSNKDRNDAIKPIINQIQEYLKTIISFLSEFMIFCVIKEKHFDVEFIAANNDIRKCDLKIENCKTEIKSFVDDFRYGHRVEESLSKEILCSLRRDKIECRINECLLKEDVNIAILHVVSTSLGMAITKYSNSEHRIEDTLKRAIDYGRVFEKETSSFLPTIIFSYYINDISHKFVISSFLVKYPLNHVENLHQVDPSSLTNHSIELF